MGRLGLLWRWRCRYMIRVVLTCNITYIELLLHDGGDGETGSVDRVAHIQVSWRGQPHQANRLAWLQWEETSECRRGSMRLVRYGGETETRTLRCIHRPTGQAWSPPALELPFLVQRVCCIFVDPRLGR